jgi:non-ribosomal peptide synthetase component F
LFDTVFNYTHFHVADRLRGIDGLEVLGVDGTEQTYYPLTAQFNMDHLSSRLELALDYRSIELGEAQAREVASYYSRVLEAMSVEPDAHHEAVSLLAKEEERQLLVELNETTAAFSEDKCVYQLFEEQVERWPDAIAVRLGSEELSYRELNLRANKLARYLQWKGVGRITRGIESRWSVSPARSGIPDRPHWLHDRRLASARSPDTELSTASPSRHGGADDLPGRRCLL